MKSAYLVAFWQLNGDVCRSLTKSWVLHTAEWLFLGARAVGEKLSSSKSRTRYLYSRIRQRDLGSHPLDCLHVVSFDTVRIHGESKECLDCCMPKSRIIPPSLPPSNQHHTSTGSSNSIAASPARLCDSARTTDRYREACWWTGMSDKVWELVISHSIQSFNMKLSVSYCGFLHWPSFLSRILFSVLTSHPALLSSLSTNHMSREPSGSLRCRYRPHVSTCMVSIHAIERDYPFVGLAQDQQSLRSITFISVNMAHSGA